ncbi:precorrin-6y C5,15-methyltransferase (decarboxylating), CbiE subunit [Ignisphaera aggregans DSM 17230]|uniref:Precorrin-6y C5,15-methyltransferase (Decarboxylating), CbiE subunit n=1 Tax=Ignisphaera aggregans (strain DSM 17230 / JCM 13409 / AQ1.S1) TaxID=583356 RepID=E0STP4_IGNAA|nr:precorrin-6y C5,15-methyltransferase (decarboxylating), CbiE subunit [Ignisphaera aggregans DSM 17230]
MWAQMLYIIGVGPGDPELITIKGVEVIKRCQIVIGWSTVVDRFSILLQNKKVIRINFREMDRQLEEIAIYAKDFDVAFLIHGDAAVSDYQLLEKIREICRKHNVAIQIIPGVTSITRALHIIGKDLAQIIFITFHIEGEVDYNEIERSLSIGRGLLVFPEPYPDGVKRIALKLREIGCGDITLIIMEKLTYSDETIWSYKVDEIIDKDLKFSDMTIVYIPPCPHKNVLQAS